MYVIIYIIKITALSGEDFYLFSIGFSELILILIIAYVFVGPQDLPKVARWFGRIVKRARALISEVKKESGWEQLVNETEDVRKELKENNRTVQEALHSVKKDFNDLGSEINKNIDEAKKTVNTF